MLSELRKVGDGKADPNVTTWISSVDAASFHLFAIFLMELELGILRVERRDAAQGERPRTWMRTRVLPEFSERTLPVDQAVALRFARLHVPGPRPERDGYIAATALIHSMTVVTRNVTDFEPTGVRLLNPWIPAET